MKNYYLAHFYQDNDVIHILGYTPLSNKDTFEFHYSSLRNGLNPPFSFIPYQQGEFADGHYMYNKDLMIFQLQDDIENCAILINIGSLENATLISHDENNNLERTQSIIDSLDIEKIKKITNAIK